MRPSATEIFKLELEHKLNFIYLVLANRIWLGMPAKMGQSIKNKESKVYKSWIALGNNIRKNLGKWYSRQAALEKSGGVPKFNNDLLKWFFDPKKEKELTKYADSLINKNKSKGIAFIPLLVWGVIAIAGMFTAAYIIDQTTTTAEERQDLLKSTEETVKNLGLSKEQAAAILTTTQVEQTKSDENKGFGLGSGIMTFGLIALAAFFLLNKKTPNN